MSMTPDERRQMFKESLRKLRDYRKLNRLCRECGVNLPEAATTRCDECRTRHARRECELMHLRPLKAEPTTFDMVQAAMSLKKEGHDYTEIIDMGFEPRIVELAQEHARFS